MNDKFLNEEILKGFVVLSKTDRLAHAYLFTGSKNSGKVSTAMEVAKWINCEENLSLTLAAACGHCPSCVKIQSANHPDVHLIYRREDSEVVSIDQVRELLGQIKLRPFSARKKVFIISEIEFLTDEAANALLKTLEEPSLNSLLILTTSAPEKVIETIKSRCHVMMFLPLSKEQIRNRLIDQYQENDLSAAVIAAQAQGSWGIAQVLQQEQFIKRRDEVLDVFVFSPWNDNFVKTVLADKKDVRQFLNLLLSLIRDMFCIKIGLDFTALMHQDRATDLTRLAKRFKFDDLNALLSDVVGMFKLLEDNLNIKIGLLMIKEKFNG